MLRTLMAEATMLQQLSSLKWAFCFATAKIFHLLFSKSAYENHLDDDECPTDTLE